MCNPHNIARDHNGNVCQLVRQDTSAVVAIYRYDAYGLHQTEARADSDTLDAAQVSQPWRYQSKWHHSQSGLVDFGYRFYAPGLGNWMSRDPLGEAGGLNLYGYVGNDPVNLHDPYGLDFLDNVSNFSAGAGDVLSFGGTKLVRQHLGVDDVVNVESGAYLGGAVTGLTVAVFIAPESAGGPGAAAVAERLVIKQALKTVGKRALVGAGSGALSNVVGESGTQLSSYVSGEGINVSALERTAASGALSGAATGAVSGGLGPKVNALVSAYGAKSSNGFIKDQLKRAQNGPDGSEDVVICKAR